jgi:phage I-like protein
MEIDLVLLARDIVLLAANDTEPPTEFRLFRAGPNETTKGVFLFDEDSQKSVMDAFERHGADLPIDYEHKMLDWLASADDMRAAGWFRPEVRNNGELWATGVTWTPKADAAIRAKEWRYISPAFSTNEEGQILSLINVALTNLPATHQLEALVAASAARAALSNKSMPAWPEKEKPMKQLLIALGLSESASEADALVALSRLKDAAGQDKVKLGQILTLTSTKDVDEAIGVVAGKVEEAKKVVSLSARVTELESGLRRKEVEAIVGEKIQSGFLEPAKRDFAVELGMDAPKSFTAFLATLTSKAPINTDGGTDKPAGPSSTNVKLTAAQKLICKQLGLTAEEFLASEEPGESGQKESALWPSAQSETHPGAAKTASPISRPSSSPPPRRSTPAASPARTPLATRSPAAHPPPSSPWVARSSPSITPRGSSTRSPSTCDRAPSAGKTALQATPSPRPTSAAFVTSSTTKRSRRPAPPTPDPSPERSSKWTPLACGSAPASASR